MSESLPTFRRATGRLAAAWRDFSYKDSLFARGAVWTLVCWALGAVATSLLFMLGDYAGPDPSGDFLRGVEPGVPALLAVFPGSPLIGFVTGAALSGGAAGFRDAMKRGFKASAFLFFSLLLLAALTMLSSSEKAGLLAAMFFWIAVLALAAGLLGAFLRWVAGPAKPASAP